MKKMLGLLLTMMTLSVSAGSFTATEQCNVIDYGGDIVNFNEAETMQIVKEAKLLKNNASEWKSMEELASMCSTKVTFSYVIRESLENGDLNMIEVSAFCEDDPTTEEAEESLILQRYDLQGDGGLICSTFAG